MNPVLLRFAAGSSTRVALRRTLVGGHHRGATTFPRTLSFWPSGSGDASNSPSSPSERTSTHAQNPPHFVSDPAHPSAARPASSIENAPSAAASAPVTPATLDADSPTAPAGGAEVADAASSVVAEATAAGGSWGDLFVQPALTLIDRTHDVTGLPWWSTIAVATVLVRTGLLPISLYTMRNSVRMSHLQDDMKLKREEVMEAVRAGNRALAEKKQEEQRQFMRAAGISPGRVLLGPLVQFPVFISFFVGIRRMAEHNVDFTTGGTAWFVDLASKDTTYGLPLLAGLTLLGMTELGGDTGAKMTNQMKMFMRGFAVLSVPMTAWFPSAVFCYWIPNNIFSVLLASVTKMPTMKRALGLMLDTTAIPGTIAAKEAAKKKLRGTMVKTDEISAATSYQRKSAGVTDSLPGRNLAGINSEVKTKLYKTKGAARAARAVGE